MNGKIQCPTCKDKSNITIQEWLGAYDGWLSLHCDHCGQSYHRTNNEKITALWQPKEYGPVYFKAGEQYFRNLREIEKEQYSEESGGC